jgi:hypothetical protein
MTVVAFKDGIMASDSMCIVDDTRAGYTKKIYSLCSGVLGVTGRVYACEIFAAWFTDFNGSGVKIRNMGEHVSPFPEVLTEGDFVGLLWDDDEGLVRIYDDATFSKVPRGFDAIGSGGDFALGAMAAGASADEAVRAAMSLDIYSGGSVQVVQAFGWKVGTGR